MLKEIEVKNFFEKIDSFEDEEIILTYEKASAEDSFDKEEIFNIYLSILFNVNQLINANEVYKNLPSYKARALVYQSILLADDVERKIYLTFLLKDLFNKDKSSRFNSFCKCLIFASFVLKNIISF